MLPSLRAWRGQVPDHFTLMRFSARVDPRLMRRVVGATASMMCGDGMTRRHHGVLVLQRVEALRRGTQEAGACGAPWTWTCMAEGPSSRQ